MYSIVVVTVAMLARMQHRSRISSAPGWESYAHSLTVIYIPLLLWLGAMNLRAFRDEQLEMVNQSKKHIL